MVLHLNVGSDQADLYDPLFMLYLITLSKEKLDIFSVFCIILTGRFFVSPKFIPFWEQARLPVKLRIRLQA